MSPPDKYGKRRQITFRIGPLAEDRLRQVAALFHMKPSEYAKAVLYRELGVFNEPLDQRRRSWRKKKQQDEEKAFRGDTGEGLPGLTAENLKRGKKHREAATETALLKVCEQRSSCDIDDPSGERCPYYEICYGEAGRSSTMQ
ncbi:MAG: hypothetical protein QW160_04490 [Candidatus Bathyarchaeia archaeon]